MMEFIGVLTSAGINIGITVFLFILYSVLRKQPSFLSVYYGRRAAMHRSSSYSGPFKIERFVPSPSWLLKAWEATEEEILALGGMDAVVFVRIIIFSIRIFCIAFVLCTGLLLPVNYFVKEDIPLETLRKFTIANVKDSRWIWTHCLALYVISCSTCVLLYFEYKSITKMRLAHITESPPNLSQFTVLVRAIPRSSEESYNDSMRKFVMKYYASSYLTHQIVYRSGAVQKLMGDAEKMYKVFKIAAHKKKPSCIPNFFCATSSDSLKMLSNNTSVRASTIGFDDFDLSTRDKECEAAFVSFKTRDAANVVREVVQSSNPMLWVTKLAPEPHDILWSNLCIPYRQLWIRKLVICLIFFIFMCVYILPILLVQTMVDNDSLSRAFPFLEGFLHQKIVNGVVQGYLPSVLLVLVNLVVPPIMMLLSKVEGAVSRSGRKRSACIKVLCFTFWSVFFANVLAGSFIDALASAFSSAKDITRKIATSVPNQGGFFMTYVMTSGWALLAVEIMQPWPFLLNFVRKFILKKKDDPPDTIRSFPYHTEVPKLLVFGMLGFICSILTPLLLPFLMIYFFLAYLVYKNQILNVYVTKYESGGQFWPIAHTTSISSLVMAQLIDVVVFLMKNALIQAGFIAPLIIGTLLFHEYCRRRYLPSFTKLAAQVIKEMDQQDEESGRMEEIHQQLDSAYCQFWLSSDMPCRGGEEEHYDAPVASKPGQQLAKLDREGCTRKLL